MPIIFVLLKNLVAWSVINNIHANHISKNGCQRTCDCEHAAVARGAAPDGGGGGGDGAAAGGGGALPPRAKKKAKVPDNPLTQAGRILCESI